MDTVLARLIFAILLLASSPVWAAVSFDVTTEVDCGAAATSCSVTGPNVGSNSNEVLLLFMGCTNGTGAALPTGMAATWDNGGTNQVMTKAHALDLNTGGLAAQLSIWYRVAPTSGAKTLNVTWTNANDCYAGMSAWFGVDQTTPLVNFTDASASDVGPATVTQGTSVPSGDLSAAGIVDAVGGQSAQTQTSMWLSNGLCCAASGARDGTGTPAFQVTLSQLSTWVATSMDIQQVQGGAAAAPQRMLMGAGQ